MKTRLLRVLFCFSFLIPLISMGQSNFQVSGYEVCLSGYVDILNLSWQGATNYALHLNGTSYAYSGADTTVQINEPTEIVVEAFDAAGASIGLDGVYITIKNSPHLNIHGDMSLLACPGEPVMFEAQPDYSVSSMDWNVSMAGGTVKSFSGNYATDTFNILGDYSVLASGQWECGTFQQEAVFSIVDTITPQVPQFYTNKDTLCPGESIRFTPNYYYRNGINWSFGDQATGFSQDDVEHVYTAAGDYVVQASVTNDCGKSSVYEKTIYVRDNLVPAKPYINGPEVICPNEEVYYGNYDSYSTLQWTIGNDTFTSNEVKYIFINTGLQEVQLTVTNTCGNTATNIMQVDVRGDLVPVVPNIYFPTPVCYNEEVYFNADGNYKAYEWQTEGIASIIRDFSHTYTSAGLQDITLTVTNGCNLSASTTQQIDVRSDLVPAPDFYSDYQACPFETINFNSAFEHKSYLWEFGDGTVSKNDDPDHFWEAENTYNVTLTVTNGCGNSAGITKQVAVSNSNPIDSYMELSNFPSKACPGAPVEFWFSSDVKNVVWDFGDGHTAEGRQVTHVYAIEGTFTPKVTVTNFCGSQADITASHPIEVSGGFSYAELIDGQPAISVMLGDGDGSSSICPGEQFMVMTNVPGNYFSWNMGDGTVKELYDQAFFAHKYSEQGTYYISVTARNGCNQEITIQDSVVVGHRDQFFIPLETESTTICPGDYFSAFYISNAQVLFDFGDGTAPAYSELSSINGIDVSSISHQYQTEGDYIVKIKGTDGCGNADSTTFPVFVVANATPGEYPALEIITAKQVQTTCDNVNFSVGGQYAATYHFGDGTSVTSADGLVSHRYNEIGVYNVYAEIATGCGKNFTTDTLIVKVDSCKQASMTANFTASNTSGQIPFTVQFADQSLSNGDPITSWTWDLNGDGLADATTQNPSYTFDTKGLYSVALIISNGTVSDTIVKQNYITAYDCADLTVDFAVNPVCQGSASNFVNNSVHVNPNANITYSWDINADGVADYTTKHATHSFTAVGSHPVSLTASTQFCTKSVTKQANVEYADVTASTANLAICGYTDTIIYVTGSQEAGQTASWVTRGAGTFRLNTVSNAEYRVAFEDKQNGRVTLVLVGDAPSCPTNMDSVTVHIIRRPIVHVGPNQALTASPVTIDATVLNANTTFWSSSGTGEIAPNAGAVDITYTPSAEDLNDGNVKLTLTASNGVCPPVSNRLVLSSNTVICNVTIDKTYNQNLVTFVATNDDNQTVGSYLWEFGDGHEASGRIQSNVYNQPGTYYVKLSYSAPDSSCTAISYDSVYISEAAIPTYTISGNVKVSGTLLDAGRVTLFKFDGYNYDFLRAKDITASENGSFIFTGLENGYYLVHALPDTTSTSFDSYVATYYGNATEWENGDFVKIDNADFTSAFISLTPYTPGTYTSGSDIIQGTVVFDINSNLKVTQGSENPVENAVVTLYNSTGDRLTSTYTDPYGNYSFENMGPGEYFVDVEYAGTDMGQNFSINADGSGTTHDGSTSVAKQDITLGNKPHTAVSALNVYPNPVNDYAVVKLPETVTGAVNLKVFTVSGLLVKEFSTNATEELTIPTDELKEGMYLLNIETEAGKWLVRFTKH